MDIRDLPEMTRGYLVAALFTDLPDGEAGSGDFEPKSGAYLARTPKATRDEAGQVCYAFAEAHAADLADYPAFAAGSDLWYSRNGHGCGFFECDHTEKDAGERLQDAARRLGSRSLVRTRGGWFRFDL